MLTGLTPFSCEQLILIGQHLGQTLQDDPILTACFFSGMAPSATPGPATTPGPQELLGSTLLIIAGTPALCQHLHATPSRQLIISPL